jgi:hypothetical protein
LKLTVKQKISETFIRGINEFKNGHQPVTNIVKDEKGELVTDTHFSQLLNVLDVNDVRQTERHIAEPIVPEPRAFDVGMVIEKPNDTNHQVLIKSQQNRLKQG